MIWPLLAVTVGFAIALAGDSEWENWKVSGIGYAVMVAGVAGLIMEKAT